MKRMFEMCLRSVNQSIEHLRPGAVAGDVAAGSEKALGPLPRGWVWHGSYAYSIGLGFPPEWGDCGAVEVAKGSFHFTLRVRDALGGVSTKTVALSVH